MSTNNKNGEKRFHGMKVVGDTEFLRGITAVEFSSANNFRACYYDKDGEPSSSPLSLDLPILISKGTSESNITSAIKEAIGTNTGGFCSDVVISEKSVDYIKRLVEI